MVCKKCGNDLKPGAKFCFNCGYYIDEESDSIDSLEDNNDNEIINKKETKKEKKERLKREKKEEKERKRREKEAERERKKIVDSLGPKTESFSDNDNSSFDDFSSSKKHNTSFLFKIFDKSNFVFLIAFLFAVLSIVLMIISFTTKNKETVIVPPENIIKEDVNIEMDNYSLIVPGRLTYQTENNNLYLGYENDYTISHSVSKETYEIYSADLSILANNMEKSGYVVLNSERKEVSDVEFLIYQLSIDGITKYLYLSQIDDEYVSMGIIELNNSQSIETPCKDIVTINKSIKFKDSVDSGDLATSVLNLFEKLGQK